MKDTVRDHVNAFHQALVLAAGKRKEECRLLPRWSTELQDFPRGSCELASNFLAEYLQDRVKGVYPVILFMRGDGNPVNGHVIVMLDGEYIDLTLDQFEMYNDYVVAEPIESGGQLSTLLRNIREKNGVIKTLPIQLNTTGANGRTLYEKVRDIADSLLPPTPQQNTPKPPLSTEILPEYRSWQDMNPTDENENR